MPNTFEGDVIEKSEHNKAVIANLREKLATQTPEEAAASLEAGFQLMADDFNSDPTYFDRQQARIDNDPDVIAERRKSEELHQIRRSLGYGALGYNSNIMTQRQRERMPRTDEERLADRIAAEDAYYASLPRPEPPRRS